MGYAECQDGGAEAARGNLQSAFKPKHLTQTGYRRAGVGRRSARERLELRYHGGGGRPICLVAADVAPADSSALVYYEGRRRSDIARADAVCVDDGLVRIVEYREGRTPALRGFLSARQVVGADRQNNGVVRLYIGVLRCQLDELFTAEGSPECAVKDEDDVLVAAVSTEIVIAAQRARQREIGRNIVDGSADRWRGQLRGSDGRQRCSGGRRRLCWDGCRRLRGNGSCRWQRRIANRRRRRRCGGLRRRGGRHLSGRNGGLYRNGDRLCRRVDSRRLRRRNGGLRGDSGRLCRCSSRRFRNRSGGLRGDSSRRRGTLGDSGRLRGCGVCRRRRGGNGRLSWRRDGGGRVRWNRRRGYACVARSRWYAQQRQRRRKYGALGDVENLCRRRVAQVRFLLSMRKYQYKL